MNRMNAHAGHVNLFFLPFPPLTFGCTINTIDTRVAQTKLHYPFALRLSERKRRNVVLFSYHIFSGWLEFGYILFLLHPPFFRI